MGSKDEKAVGGGFFSAITSSVRNWGTAMHKSVNGYEFSQDLLPLYLNIFLSLFLLN